MITLDDFNLDDLLLHDQIQVSQAEAMRALAEMIERTMRRTSPEDPKEKCTKHNERILHEKEFYKMVRGEANKPIKVVYEGANSWEVNPDCIGRIPYVGRIPNLHAYSFTTSA